MLFTNGKLQSFEQMMKQPPHRPQRSPKKPSKPHPMAVSESSLRKDKPRGNQ